MRDPRITQLATNLIHYSCQLQPGENLLIEVIGLEKSLVAALIEEAYRAQAIPFVEIKDRAIDRTILLGANEAQIKAMARYETVRMSEMAAYIGIRAGDNATELADVPPGQIQLYQRHFIQEVHSKLRVRKTKWVVLRFPNPAMAQLANMSTEAFENFYFKVCNLDYARLSQAMDPLVALMNRTDQVRITGSGTDLSFSIKGVPAIKCDGRMNIPDGEVYTAPVKNSINGHITYSVPAIYQGVLFENIRFDFREGRIVAADSSHRERLNQILDTDDGARSIGEFALGVNPFITHPMRDTLFDEKIAGSFHLTPGNAYEECDNQNRSAVHWDLVSIQTPEYGGGEIYFDGQLIRRNGLFVLPELAGLNPSAFLP